MSRIAFRSACRAGAMTMINSYRTASNVRLNQVYRARVAEIKSPCVFVDSIREDTTSFTTEESQRVIRVGIRAVWGQYDSGTAIDQADAFVDSLYAYVMANYHAFGENTECVWTGTADDENWSPEWIPADNNSYFSTLVTLEGRAST